MIEINSDVLCVAETWSTRERLEKQTWFQNLEGTYICHIIDAVRSNQMGRLKGGILLAVKKKAKRIQNVRLNSNYATLDINNMLGKGKLTLAMAYISPDKDEDTNYCQLIELLQSRKVNLIIGDLNSRVGTCNPSGILRKSKDKSRNARGKKLSECDKNVHICNGAVPGDASGEYTFVNKNGASVVDLCVINTEFKHLLRSLKVKSNPFSHHCLLNIDIGEKASEAKFSVTNRIKWKADLKYAFKGEIGKLHADRENSSISYKELNENIYRAARKVGMKTSVSVGKSMTSPLWMDSELRALKAKYRKMVKAFRSSNAHGDFQDFIFSKNQMLEAKKKYLEATNKKKAEYFSKVCENICNSKDSKQFWDALNTYRSRRKSVDYGDITKEEWKDHFKQIFQKYVDHSVHSETVNCNEGIKDEILDSEINMFELNLAIKKLSNGKAPGEDGIPNEVWKNLHAIGKQDLLNLFNKCYNHPELIPEEWSKITIVPIFKKGDVNSPGNYRPISLINTITKLFTTVLAKRLTSFCKKYKKLSECQAGFKEGTGCVDQIFNFNTVIQKSLQEKGGKLYSVFVDLSQAFDSVRHDILWRKLRDKGLSDKFMNTLIQLYSKAKANIRISSDVTEEFEICNSVLQGESLSPKLFTLFLDDVVKAIESTGIKGIKIGIFELHMLLFADDIVLFGRTENELQRKINALFEYFTQNSLKVNLSKTKVVVFRKGSKLASGTKFKWGNEKVDIVNSYTYLGVTFHYSGSFSMACDTFIQKATKAMNGLIGLFVKARINRLSIQEKLFGSLCRSVLLYGVVVWGPAYLEKLVDFQFRFLRKLFYLAKETPRWKIMLETDFQPVENIVIKLLLKFLFRIKNKPSDSLVKQCFEVSVAESRKKYKNNWVVLVNNIFQKFSLPKITKELQFLQRQSYIRSIAAKQRQSLTQNYVDSMIKNAGSYASIKQKVGRERYFEGKCTFASKRLMFHIRCNNNYITCGNQSCNLNSINCY